MNQDGGKELHIDTLIDLPVFAEQADVTKGGLKHEIDQSLSFGESRPITFAGLE